MLQQNLENRLIIKKISKFYLSVTEEDKRDHFAQLDS